LSPTTAKFFEGVDFGNLINENYIILRVRFTSQITKDMRIRFKDKAFLIKKMVNVLEQNKLFEIIAMEVA
jgi:head-tail adaptor